MSLRLLYGFHAVGARLRVAPQSVRELLVDSERHDARMRQLTQRAQEAGVQVQPVDAARLDALVADRRHQGVVARVEALAQPTTLDAVLDAAGEQPLLLGLDGVTDPHNLGAMLRSADAAGVHAVFAPKDRAVGLTPTVAKVASGAADTVPYLMVTNMARALAGLRERGVRVVGTAGEAGDSVYAADLRGPTALVLGAEGSGLRRLVREGCDQLVHIPMLGSVDSLNVSVAAGVCLFEAVRQRLAPP
ncbi:MAG: 23S rRNA (guanosine(2251)-2'-O)-methyltransferase RlmB [Betaproteobacteria bacterium]|nr:23S rRNA (guanosine(2251)-2'-O)-methyltransferase RlmB [Betaproteobacteria bacterium]MDE1957240.1 23S rRNA (guanosine(2251)-2'-O)-methyltransferase RlmB [Betaproteobacteria bacterium]MDE2152490.1 23S rRNA (guanosine(2251)-2'-O)-methyltransferase RlmB [Betaproteobacteria bacterium]